jgi:lysophospholipase L1-like esterase
MPLTSLQYFSCFPLLPVMALQGRHVRRITPVLPEASGPATGVVEGVGEPLELLVLGESTAAGCGVSLHTEGMGGQLAAALSAKTGLAVSWRVVGRNGVTAKVTRRELLPLVPAEPVDLVAILLGVNDTKNLTPTRRWKEDLRLLFGDLRVRVGPAKLLVSGVPPMGSFPALPVPLRQFLGLRAELMDAALREVLADTTDATYAGPIAALSPDTFCIDRFHPGASGYARWAEGLAEAVGPITPRTTPAGSSEPADSTPR